MTEKVWKKPHIYRGAPGMCQSYCVGEQAADGQCRVMGCHYTGDPVQTPIPLRLETYVKVARWLSEMAQLPDECGLEGTEVEKLSSALHAQKCMCSILDYEVTSFNIRVAIHSGGEYLFCDVETGYWSVRTPFKELESLNCYLHGGLQG